MKVVIITINYFSVQALNEFYASVKAALDADTHSSAELYVIDNSGDLKNECGFHQFERLTFTIETARVNLGYFGAKKLLKDYNFLDADYVIYCNCDLKLDVDFLKELRNLNVSSDMMAPAILSRDGKVNSNPKYLKRLSKRKLQRIKLIKSFSLIDWVYTSLSELTLLLKPGQLDLIKNGKSYEIYAPHGSLLIFKNKDFFKGLNEYNSFMFCEELYVAEEARLNNLKINYCPSLRVYDDRHQSISKVATKIVAIWYRDSLDFILNKYYK